MRLLFTISQNLVVTDHVMPIVQHCNGIGTPKQLICYCNEIVEDDFESFAVPQQFVFSVPYDTELGHRPDVIGREVTHSL